MVSLKRNSQMDKAKETLRDVVLYATKSCETSGLVPTSAPQSHTDRRQAIA